MNKCILVKKWNKAAEGKKSNTIVDGGDNKYYLKKGVNCYQDKMYDVEIEETEFKGKKILWINKAIETKAQLGTPEVAKTDPIPSKLVDSTTKPSEPIKQAVVRQEIKLPDWEGKERRSIRTMLTSYAKDLVVSARLDISEINNWVNDQCDNIYEVDKQKEQGEDEEAGRLTDEQNSAIEM